MDDDFFSTCLLEDDDIQFDDDQDLENYSQDGERCGICMDIVIDRGVLDCCEHWFCFLCIDNWATITNLCPLCQNEFHSISCVPVYDTIGTSKGTKESCSRDSEWSIEEKRSTLSFPSYYIDENAVVCLDGDGCKLQSCLESNSDVLNMDTSIACDSCDLWYHAFCVGFDTNSTSESTWLCPRCTRDEQHKSNGTSVYNPGDQLILTHTKEGSRVESGLSSMVSVSIADTGETAVVVSVVTESQSCEGSKENSLTRLEVDTPVPCLNPCISEGGPSVSYVLQNCEHLEVGPSVLLESSKKGLPNLVVNNHSKEDIFDKDGDDGKIFGEAEGKLETSIYCTSSVNYGDVIVMRDRDEEMHIVSHLKRKVRDCSTETIATIPGKEIKSQLETVGDASKRPRTDESDTTETCSISDGSSKNPHFKTDFNDEKLRQSMQQGAKTDILDTAHDSTSEAGKESGRRVKKIMRRSTESENSSSILQRLRQEIREAVQNKSTKNVGVLFNPKLLEAFRAAVAGPKPVQNRMLSPSALKTKKSLLQKGKVRENLTKKIYTTSNGRRKRAWDRDCEIEFWKHRCLQTSKPEKIETLKLVLGLLRSSSEDPEAGELISHNDANPILSRLYLADTSIFPRKDNIKPVVALHEPDTRHLSGEEQACDPSTSMTLLSNPLGGDLKAEGGSGKTYSPEVINKGINRLSSLKVPDACTGVSHTQRKGSDNLQSGVSKSSSQREVVGQSNRTSDKRRWALEVLARKTAKPGQIKSSHEHLEDTSFERNYPVLAQLPVDIRPTPSTIRREKIPMHVRQTQLYRLTEQLLKQANIPVKRKTATTELAVADAVNIEKGIAERSNSKLVYVNLCSQEVLRHSELSTTNSEVALNLEPVLPSAGSTNMQTNNEDFSDPTVEEALNNAGLLPESPPGGPRHPTGLAHGVDVAANKMEDYKPDNLLEINCHSELDISGGFGHAFDLEDHKDVKVHAIATNSTVREPKLDMILSPLTTLMSEKNEQNAGNISTETLENLPICPSFIEGNTEDHCLDPDIDLEVKEFHTSPKIPDENGRRETTVANGKEFDSPSTEILPFAIPVGYVACDIITDDGGNRSKAGVGDHVIDRENLPDNYLTSGVPWYSAETMSGEPSKLVETIKEEKKSDICNSVSKKVEAFIKEHIRPLCKSGVITVEQYKWAVVKTTRKVMKYHTKDKNASFLIKEGDKVKKLALQYLEGSQKTE